MPRLTNLETIEVSLVPKGANKKKFLIYKSDEEGEKMEIEVLKKLLETEITNNLEVEELMKAMKISDKAKNAVTAALRILTAYKGELPQGLFASLSELAGVTKAIETTKSIDKKGGIEKMKKEDIEKMEIPEEMKKNLEIVFKENEDMVKVTKTLQEQITKGEEKFKQSEDVRLIKEFTEIAKTYDKISINPDEFGKIMKELADVATPESMTKLQEVLKSANELIAKGDAFKEIGSSAQGESDAWGKIEAIAKELAVSGKMSKEVAITKALELNPDLYSAYLNEGRN
jgi:adenine-specific DNA glycosylase